MSSRAELILSQIQALPLRDQLDLAEAMDRLTWAHRWRQLCERVESGLSGRKTPSDDEIDAEVSAVRKERPLSSRFSIPPS